MGWKHQLESNVSHLDEDTAVCTFTQLQDLKSNPSTISLLHPQLECHFVDVWSSTIPMKFLLSMKISPSKGMPLRKPLRDLRLSPSPVGGVLVCFFILQPFVSFSTSKLRSFCTSARSNESALILVFVLTFFVLTLFQAPGGEGNQKSKPTSKGRLVSHEAPRTCAQ